jgi:hypothetical protein
MSEIITSDLSSRIIANRFGSLFRKRLKNSEQISAFQDVFLENSCALLEAINSGERTFSEFLDLIEKSTKFRDWVGARNPDENLIREYGNAVSAQSWIEKLPRKSIRFALVTLGGLASEAIFPTGGVGTMIGVGIGASDTLLLDRLARGWKPNQFVERHLKLFTST